MQHSATEPGSQAIGPLALRKGVGVLGMSFPFILSFGALILFSTGIQTSISSYYHTGMGDVFVGTLCAIGVFMLAYRGYKGIDHIAGNLACFFAIGVALFPTNPPGDATKLEEIIGVVHVVFAALFFLTLAFFSLFLFTKTDLTKKPSPRKRLRNQIYRACGYAIVASILLIAIQAVLSSETKQVLSAYNPVYWLESLAVVAFGISWFVKAETMFRDDTRPLHRVAANRPD